MLLDLYQRGILLLDAMVTSRYPLVDFARAFDDLEAGRGAKTVVVMR
jgi:Zn-dependent alcohol dehydrogenase